MANRWLSPNECLVLCLIAKDSSIKGASFKMNIRPSTARTYAQRAYRKLGVTNREDAVLVHPYHRPTPSRSCHRHVVRLSSQQST